MIWMNINRRDIMSGKDYDALVVELEGKIAEQDDIILHQRIYSDSVIMMNRILDMRYDSITVVKQRIKYIHDAEITTLPTSTDFQLDSIIRSAWK